MWLRLTTNRDELVLNPDHIKRLLNEGAIEIPDPRGTPADAQAGAETPSTAESEQSQVPEAEENATDPALPVVAKDDAPTTEP